MTLISIDCAKQLVMKALTARGVEPENARITAEQLVQAEVDGQLGHGLSRVAAYASQASSGKVKGYARSISNRVAPAFISVDAGNGFAFPAISQAIEELSELARQQGIAAAAIYRSHHAGQLGAHVEALAQRGLVALMFARRGRIVVV